MKKIIIIGSIIVTSLFLSLSSGNAWAQRQVMVGGATVGTSPYVFALGFTTLANKYHPTYKFIVQATGGSLENIKLLNQKELDIGMVTPSVLTAAKEGKRWFKDLRDSKKERYDNIKGIFVYFSTTLHLIVKDGSTIRSVHDVRGKRVALGAPGSTAGLWTISILDAHGLKKNVDYTGVELDGNAASQAWQDGMVDVWCMLSEVPGGLVSNATALNKFRLVPLDDEKAIKALRENKVLSVEEGTLLSPVEPGVYPSLTNKEKVIQLSTLSSHNAHKDVSDDIVYGYVKSIFDHLDELYKNVGPSSRTVNLKDALSGMVVPFHPGAGKYFQEKGIVK